MKKYTAVFLLVFLSVIQASYAATQQLKLTITDVPTFFGEFTSIYFSPGTSTVFVPVQDNGVVFNVDTGVPQIYSMSSDNVGCGSNGYGEFTTCTEIRLGYRVEGGSTYSIEASLIANFDIASIIEIEDKTLGIFHNLLQGPYYFQAAQFEHSESRFVLHISYPPAMTITAADCNNDDGVLSVYQQTCFTWDSSSLYNSIGQPIQSFSNITGSFSFPGLSEGMYTLNFYYGLYTVGKTVTIDGHQILSSIYTPSLNGVTGEAMNFSAWASNTDWHEWNFGDGSKITGVANPDYTFLEAGTYTVTLICTNIYGCSDTATITVVISQGTLAEKINENEARIYTQSKNLNIDFSLQPEGFSFVELYNPEGKRLLMNPLVSSYTSIDLHHLSAGVYIVAIKGKENIYSRKIILTE